MKWYTKLILIFAGMILVVGGFIAYDIITERDILADIHLPGSMGKVHTWSFQVTEPGNDYLLIVYVDVEDGWGDPLVRTSISVRAPDGSAILNEVGKDGFGGEVANPDFNVGHTGSYERKFPFAAPRKGVYQLDLEVFTDHVENVHVSVTKPRT